MQFRPSISNTILIGSNHGIANRTLSNVMEKDMKEKNENMRLIRNSMFPEDVEDILSDPTKWLDDKVIHHTQNLIKLVIDKTHF